MGRARDEQGNIWETDAQGNAIRLVQAAGAAAAMPADPTFGYKGPQAGADLGKTQADTTGRVLDNRVTEATLPSTVRKATADATTSERNSSTAGLPEGFMWAQDGKTAIPIPGYTRQGLSPEVRSNAIQAFADADAIAKVADDLEAQFKAGPGSTKGVYGLADYLPTATNATFNDTGQRARGYVKRSLGFTGGEGNTMAESTATYGPYLPMASDRDTQIQSKIKALRELGAQARKKAIATLGGAPDANGNISPLPNALTATRIGGGDPMQAAAFGSTTGVTDQYPPEMVQAHQQLIMRLMAQNGGKLDPQAYAQERAKLNQQFGFAGDPQADAQWASGINDYLGKGGKTVPGDIKPPERDLSTFEALRNSAANNPIVAGGINYADAVGMGGISYLDRATGGGRMDALNEANPISSTLGQVAGAFKGVPLAGTIAGATLGKAIAPRMFAYGRAKLGRNGMALARDLATEGAYSGITGHNQGMDPTVSTLLGVGGAVGGRAIGKTVGTLAEGVQASPAVQYLRDRNIPLTVGQTLGGAAKSIEDAATSLPVIGDMIGRRYKDSLRGLSHAAAEDVGQSIGYKPPAGKYGRELTSDMGDAIGDYYTNTVQGANVPLDGQYAADFTNVAAKGAQLPDDLRGKFALALNNRVNPINDAGVMTGDTYQQAMRGLKGYKGEHVKPGFEADYRDALSSAQDALRGQMVRGGGADVAQGLDRADTAYRLYKTFDNAVQRADGAGYLPTASQIQDAVKATGKKFPGKNPLLDLADNAQEVLPSKLPDSGTPRRLIQYGLGATALGGAQASDAYGGTDIINPYSIGALALLAAGGTRAGQKAATKALMDRPQALKMAGKYINTRLGMFGRAGIPLALEYQRNAERQ